MISLQEETVVDGDGDFLAFGGVEHKAFGHEVDDGDFVEAGGDGDRSLDVANFEGLGGFEVNESGDALFANGVGLVGCIDTPVEIHASVLDAEGAGAAMPGGAVAAVILDPEETSGHGGGVFEGEPKPFFLGIDGGDPGDGGSFGGLLKLLDEIAEAGIGGEGGVVARGLILEDGGDFGEGLEGGVGGGPLVVAASGIGGAHGIGAADIEMTGGDAQSAGCLREAETGVMGEGGAACKALDEGAAVDGVVAFDQGELAVDGAGSDFRIEPDVERGGIFVTLSADESPGLTGGFAMRRVLLAAVGRGVTAKGEAEEIATQGSEDGRGKIREAFILPWADEVWLHGLAIETEGDWGHVPAEFCDGELDVVVAQEPGRLCVDTLSGEDGSGGRGFGGGSFGFTDGHEIG